MNSATSAQQLRGGFGFGSNGDRFGRGFDRGFDHGFGRGFGRGCWNCGFGFGGWGGWGWGGWGFGWGWPGFGLWGWDPFWSDPWWGYPAAGYGYYPPPDYNVYGAPDAGYSAPYNDPNSSSQQDYQDNSRDNSYDQGAPNGNWVTPNGASPSRSQNSGALAVPVLIYLKSGRVLSVRDYWMVDGELHYLLMNGAQNSIDLQQVDLPRTNTENAKSGVRFIFKSEPSAPAEPDAEPGTPN